MQYKLSGEWSERARLATNAHGGCSNKGNSAPVKCHTKTASYAQKSQEKNDGSQDNMQRKQTAGAKLFQHPMKDNSATQSKRTLSGV
jgi:hypothetical protein